MLGVSFFNNCLNRVTITQLTTNETLPMMSLFRPLMQKFPKLNSAMHRSLMKPGSSAPPKAGQSAQCRPHSNHPLQRSFVWAAGNRSIAAALAHLDFVVNYQLRGRFLPLDLWCAAATCHMLTLLTGWLPPAHGAHVYSVASSGS